MMLVNPEYCQRWLELSVAIEDEVKEMERSLERWAGGAPRGPKPTFAVS